MIEEAKKLAELLKTSEEVILELEKKMEKIKGTLKMVCKGSVDIDRKNNTGKAK